MAKHLGFLAHMTLWVKCSIMIDVYPAFILLSAFNFDFFSRNTGLISVKLGLKKAWMKGIPVYSYQGLLTFKVQEPSLK